MKNSWKLKFFIYDDLKLNRNGKIDKSKSRILKIYNLEHLKRKNIASYICIWMLVFFTIYLLGKPHGMQQFQDRL